jgi:metal-responsive CopG/Arc/MetJ family transcriptional regulator
MKKKHMVPMTIKADQSMLNEIDELCKSSPHLASRAEFMRDALFSYLHYYQSVLLPAMNSQKSVQDFYRDEGALRYKSEI